MTQSEGKGFGDLSWVKLDASPGKAAPDGEISAEQSELYICSRLSTPMGKKQGLGEDARLVQTEERVFSHKYFRCQKNTQRHGAETPSKYPNYPPRSKKALPVTTLMKESNPEVPALEQPYGDIGITGYPFPPCRIIADIYRPRLCDYKGLPEGLGFDLNLNPRRRAPQLDHVDLVKVWRGLSSDKAEELVFWEAKFREALVDLLQGQVQLFDLYSESLSDSSKSQNGGGRVRYFAVDIVDLAIEMVAKAKRHGLPSFRWFTSSVNIYTTVAQFIQTHDCFTYTGSGIEGLSIGVVLRRKSRLDAFPRMPALVEAQWNPDFLSFDQWDYLVVEGDTFCLRPHYRSPSRDWDFSSFPRDSGLHFTSSVPWLKWDYGQSAFIGIVPIFSKTEERPQANGTIPPDSSESSTQPYAIGIMVTATMMEYFPGGVCYEQTARARVTINVTRRPFRDQIQTAGQQRSNDLPVDIDDGQQSEDPGKCIPDKKWPDSVFRDDYLGLNDASSLAPDSSKSFVSYGRISKNFDFMKGFFSSPFGSSYYGSPASHLDEGLKVFPLRYCTDTDRRLRQPSFDVVPHKSPEGSPSPPQNDQVVDSPEAQEVAHPSPRRLRELEAWDEPTIALQLEELADQQGFPRHFCDDSESENMDVASKPPMDEDQSLSVPPRTRSISGASRGSIHSVKTLGSNDIPSPPLFGDAIASSLSDGGDRTTPECTSTFPDHYRATRIKAKFFIGPDDDSRTNSPEKQNNESSQTPDIEKLGKYHPMISSRVNSIRGRQPGPFATLHKSHENLEQLALADHSWTNSGRQHAGSSSQSSVDGEELEQYSRNLRSIFKEGASKMPEWTTSDCEDMLQCGSLGSSFDGVTTPHGACDRDGDRGMSRDNSGTALNSVRSGLVLPVPTPVRQISA